jgi:hypothetical protein
MKSGCKINEGVIRYDFEIQPSFDRSGRNLPLRNECLCAGELWHPEQRAACTSDAFKLCSSNIPDAAKVETCLEAEQIRSQQCVSIGFRTRHRPFGQ